MVKPSMRETRCALRGCSAPSQRSRATCASRSVVKVPPSTVPDAVGSPTSQGVPHAEPTSLCRGRHFDHRTLRDAQVVLGLSATACPGCQARAVLTPKVIAADFPAAFDHTSRSRSRLSSASPSTEWASLVCDHHKTTGQRCAWGCRGSRARPSRWRAGSASHAGTRPQAHGSSGLRPRGTSHEPGLH